MDRSAIDLVTRCVVLLCVAAAVPRITYAAENDPTNRTILLNTTDSWAPGDRIRVTSPEPYRVHWTGWFASVEADSVLRMRLSRELDPIAVRLSQIGTLEEKVGTKRHWRTGAEVGCLLGLLIGAAIAASSEDPKVPIPGLGTIQLNGLRQTYVVIGGASGLILGGAIGYTIRSDRWGIVARFD